MATSPECNGIELNGTTATLLGQQREAIREQLIGHNAKRALAFQTTAVRHFSPAAGIFCRQLLFWDGRGRDPEGWIYKSIDEWKRETGLSRRQQVKARKVLKGKRMMEEKYDLGPDRRQRLFFRLNLLALMDELADDLMADNSQDEDKPSTYAQGCSLIASEDHDQYYSAETMPVSNPQAIQESTQETMSEDLSSPRGQDFQQLGEEIEESGGPSAPPDEPSWLPPAEGDMERQLSAKDLVTMLVRGFKEMSYDIGMDTYALEMYGHNFKLLIASEAPYDEELGHVVDHIVDDPSASPQEALREVRARRSRACNELSEHLVGDGNDPVYQDEDDMFYGLEEVEELLSD